MSFEWDQITAIASMVGVVGGLISVVFLILEVRHNAHAIEGTTVQSLMSLEFEVFGKIADNAELYAQGASGDQSLSPGNRLRFDRLVGSQMSLYYSAYVQFQEGLMDAEVWDAYHNALHQTMMQPGFARCWESMSHRYPRSFRIAIAPLVPEPLLPVA